MFPLKRLFSRTGFGAIALGSLPLLTVGCASPGQPLAPSLHLPSLAEKLSAERNGDAVRLAWTTPATTTDKERIKGAVTAVVCLELNPSRVPETRKSAKKQKRAALPGVAVASPPTCNAVKSTLLTVPGPSSTEIKLLPELATGPPRLVAYRIELENGQGRTAGPSDAAFVVAGAAPPAAGAVTVTAKRDGALVRWETVPGGAPMELKRTLIATAAGPVTAVAEKKAGPAPFTPGNGRSAAREVVLRATGSGKDAGGMLDTSVVDGSTYTYVAQRVSTVTLGEQTLELRGEASPVATFAYHDTFPPEAPTGLVLVPGGGFGEAPSIDLSWNVNTEADVLGYNVYRREGTGGGFVKVTAEPVAAPAFRDMHVVAGRQYTYRVTAVDQRKNESAASAEAGEQLR